MLLVVSYTNVINLHYMYLANASCDTGSVRLVNGTTMSEGIVEVCLNGVWGNIISTGWNTPDAEVVCRQLGLLSECESYNHKIFIYVCLLTTL